MPELRDLAQFGGDVHSTTQQCVVVQFAADSGAGQFHIRHQRERVVLQRTFDTKALGGLDVMELGQAWQHTFGLRNDQLQRHAGWARLGTQLRDRDFGEVCIALQIVVGVPWVLRRLRGLITQWSGVVAVPAVVHGEGELLRHTFKLYATFQVLEFLRSWIAGIHVELRTDVGCHQHVVVCSTSQTWDFHQEAVFLTTLVHREHVAARFAELVLVLHLHLSRGHEFRKTVDLRVGRELDAQMFFVAVHERRQNIELLVFGFFLQEVTQDVVPFITWVFDPAGDDPALGLEDLFTHQLVDAVSQHHQVRLVDVDLGVVRVTERTFHACHGGQEHVVQQRGLEVVADTDDTGQVA